MCIFRSLPNEASFGAKVIVPKTGVLLSNALGGFSADGINAVAPHKRMASSMSPTIASRQLRPEIVIGSPGGDTIPNSVAQALRNVIDYGMTVDAAVEHPRAHHQNSPDVVRLEKARPPSKAIISYLEGLGYRIELSALSLGDVKLIVRDPQTGEAWGYADPREGGLALGVSSKQ